MSVMDSANGREKLKLAKRRKRAVRERVPIDRLETWEYAKRRVKNLRD